MKNPAALGRTRIINSITPALHLLATVFLVISVSRITRAAEITNIELVAGET